MLVYWRVSRRIPPEVNGAFFWYVFWGSVIPNLRFDFENLPGESARMERLAQAPAAVAAAKASWIFQGEKTGGVEVGVVSLKNLGFV